jgi:hypothetical protein
MRGFNKYLKPKGNKIVANIQIINKASAIKVLQPLIELKSSLDVKVLQNNTLAHSTIKRVAIRVSRELVNTIVRVLIMR